MKYATVCSGIGAPEEAWKELWGPPVFTSEIEPFPSAVLKHHMPDVPNYGDMTKYKEWPDHELDVLIGGTPCQSFSVAGLRRSLDDDRGNLTLTFLGIARRYKPRFTIWENVPGVLNTSDNAFGCFLGGLVGADKVPVPDSGQGQGWGNSGFIYGPERLAAWRVLDAQHFGVPQRRRRVFVIANPREMGFASCQILFEPESLRGNIKTRREAGEGVAGCFEVGPGGNRQTEIVPTLDARCKDGPIRNQIGTLVHTFTQEQEPKWEDGEKVAHTLGTYNGRKQAVAINARQDPISIEDKALPLDVKGNTQAVAIQDGRDISKNQNGLGIDEGGPSYTLDQTGGQAVAFAENTRDEVRLVGGDGSVVGALAAEPGMKQTSYIKTQSIVRRLTPMECERLQGFPDGYTLIPGKYKFKADVHHAIIQFIMRHFNMKRDKAITLAGNPDGPRYKALGNSMAVPVVRWIGRRIQMWEDLNK